MPRSDGHWRLWVAATAVLLAAADTYVVVLALPDIMSGVGLTTTELQKAAPIISAFLLGYVALLPLVGRLSDTFGRVPTLVGCLAVFTVGSCFTAGAHALPLIIAGRFLQGLGGGGLVPVTLALVADLWPAQRRGLPLGVVGAVQELGSLLGPLFGAAVVAWSGWRAIFWINATAGAGLGAALLAGGGRSAAPGDGPAARRPRADCLGAGLGLLTAAGALLLLAQPASLVDSVTYGSAYVPLAAEHAWSPLVTPLALGTAGAGVAFVARELAARHPLLRLRGLPRLARSADLAGALLLAAALACVIVTFSTADPSKQVMVSFGPELLAAAGVLAVAFVARELRVGEPLVDFPALRDRAAVGAVLTSLLLGAALMAALVDIPVFARATAYPNSQLQAALVLVRFLVGVPIGAVLGGAVCERLSYRVTAAGGLALAAAMFVLMAGWGGHALATHGLGTSDVVLAACGLGVGLAAAPVNAAALRAVAASRHGLVTALVVVARTIGMLVGLSVLTAVGLRRFFEAQRHIASPFTLCPSNPADCPKYDALLTHAALDELHVIFVGAAVAAAAAAVLAAVLLRRGRRATTAPVPA